MGIGEQSFIYCYLHITDVGVRVAIRTELTTDDEKELELGYGVVVDLREGRHKRGNGGKIVSVCLKTSIYLTKKTYKAESQGSVHFVVVSTTTGSR